jgi:hypothetical protein
LVIAARRAYARGAPVGDGADDREIARPVSGENRLVRNGFSMDIRPKPHRLRHDLVTIKTPFCSEAAARVPRRASQDRGEDGIFGLPGWPWRADDAASSPQPRLVIKWLGRTWPGPARSSLVDGNRSLGEFQHDLTVLHDDWIYGKRDFGWWIERLARLQSKRDRCSAQVSESPVRKPLSSSKYSCEQMP